VEASTHKCHAHQHSVGFSDADDKSGLWEGLLEVFLQNIQLANEENGVSAVSYPGAWVFKRGDVRKRHGVRHTVRLGSLQLAPLTSPGRSISR
jgi:hypothetical protein